MDPENPKRIHFDPQTPSDTTPVRVQFNEVMGAGEGVGLLLRPPAIPPVSPPSQPYKYLPSTDLDDDWKYSMRREMQETIPGLYLGPYAACSRTKLESLKSAGITHIVCVRHIIERNVIRPVHEGHFIYLVLEMGEDCNVSFIPYCNRVIKFIDSAFNDGGKVLVHGNGGFNRSAALVVGYIMAAYGVGLKETLRFVQSKRFACCPNGWFMAQLKEYEAIYQAMHDVPHQLPEEGEIFRPAVPKRRFAEISCDDDDDELHWDNFDTDQNMMED